VLDQLAEPGFRERADEIGAMLRTRLEGIASRHDEVGEVRSVGPMLALELAERSPDRAREITVAARSKGLLLLSCGLYGNVIRLLPPLTASDEELDRGLAILERSL
jgi:4-aminobutyrate aminotransferase-like enzyme